MTPEEAYQEALRRIRKAEETGAVELELDLSGLKTLNRLTRELERPTSPIALPLAASISVVNPLPHPARADTNSFQGVATRVSVKE